MKNLLSIATRFLDKKLTIPILGAIRLQADGSRLTITATNIDRWFTGTVETREEFTALVNGQRFASFVAKNDDVSLSLKGNRLTAVTPNGKAQFLTTMPDDYPKMPELPPVTVTLSRRALLESFRGALCGTEEDRTGTFFQNVAQFKVKEGRFRCLSADGRRIVFSVGACTGDDTEFLIPLMAIRTMVALLGGDGDVAVHDSLNHLFFTFDNKLFGFRKMSVRFPDVDEYLNRMKFVKAFSVDAQALQSSLDIVHAMVDERLLSVKWTLGEDVTFSIYNKEVGDVEQRLGIKPELELVTGYNLSWLLPIARELEGEVGVSFCSIPSNVDGVPPNHMLRLLNTGEVKTHYLVSSLNIK